MEVLLLAYDIFRCVPAHTIHQEHQFGSPTITEGDKLCSEVLEYVLGGSQKIGGPNKTVEIDDSKFSQRIYNRGHKVKGQWVFVGVERESGKTFLVPIPDRTADTFIAVISDWIEPGTTVIGDCWSAYWDIETHGYTHQTVNHTIGFVDERTGTHTNTTESTNRHVKAFRNPYNRVNDHICHLAHYICGGVPIRERGPVH